jgi:hypothetical protein
MDSEENTVVDESLYVDENEKYKNCYDDALKILNTNMDDYTKVNFHGIVNIVPYSINKNGKYPFIEFMLNKTKEVDKYELTSDLKFYRFFYMNNLDILEYSNNLLNISFSHIIDDLVDFNKYYKGYVSDKNIVYLFYDCTEINKDSTATNFNNMWVTVSKEIFNKYSYDMSINSDVVDFFMNNYSFLYLMDTDGHSYELPEVGYTGSSLKKAEFRSVFSNTKSDIDEIFGPYYYFTSYDNAVEDAVEEKSKMNTIIKYGGMNRYALFRGKSISFYDYSNVDDNVNHNLFDSDWTADNDSIYIENLIALKDYKQHVPLSYHLV